MVGWKYWNYREVAVPHLVVIYGAPLAGKSSLARELAQALEGKTAIVSTDALLDESIVTHDHDPHAELEMVHTQARLLVANYLKNRYNVIFEGAFRYERDGATFDYEPEIDQTLSLMRNLAWSPLIVRVMAKGETLSERARTSQRSRDAEAAIRIDSGFRQRYGSSSMVVSSDEVASSELADEILIRLRGEQG